MGNQLIVLCYLLLVHYIADFIVQSQKSAENKSHSFRALWEHIFSYYAFSLVSICLPALLISPTNTLNIGLIYYVACVSVLHMITDFFTSKFNAKMYKSKKTKLFWVGIGGDQLLHQIQIIYFYGLFIAGGV
jgi:NhaP-type Na+/H+ or K+/H+ antiporter